MNPARATAALPRRDGHASIIETRDAVARWLLEGPPRITSGSHAGAIAGETIAGRAAYVYPEITGYYLQWLAHRARRHGVSRALVARAGDVQRWLVAWISDPRPRTRIHFDPAVADWRNDALFLFDLALVLRGIASAAETGLLEADAMLVERLCARLATLIAADGQLDAARAHPGAANLPRRWSTRRGAFLSKPAAGILTAARVLPQIPDALVSAAAATWSASLDAALTRPHAELHPCLYALEGWLALPDHPRFEAACAPLGFELERRLAPLRFGVLAESLASPGRPRLDVIAQALRIVLLLSAHSPASAVPARAFRALTETLCSHVEADGGLRFALDDPPGYRNVWTSMFAEQALDYAAADGPALASVAAAPCIV